MTSLILFSLFSVLNKLQRRGLNFILTGSNAKLLNGLLAAGRELSAKKLLVITWDEENEEEYKGKKIVFMPLWKWLLPATI